MYLNNILFQIKLNLNKNLNICLQCNNIGMVVFKSKSKGIIIVVVVLYYDLLIVKNAKYLLI